MPKVLKRLLITVLVIALVGGGVYGGLLAYKKANTKPVNVYSMNGISMTEYWGDSSETYGMVTADKLQNVYVSDTQTVTEICVTEGQTVVAGDPLLVYDSTLSDIDLKKAEINLKKLNAKLETAKKDLQVINKLTPYSVTLVTPPEKDIRYESEATPLIVSGTGTMDDPLYVLMAEGDAIDGALIAQMVAYAQGSTPADPTDPADPVDPADPANPADPADPADPANPTDPTTSADPQVPADTTDPEEEESTDNAIYAAFITREYDALNGMILSSWGLSIENAGSAYAFRYYDPILSEEILEYDYQDEPYYEEHGSPYTSAEIAQMKSDKEKEISDLEADIKIAEVDLERLKKEVSDNVVRAEIDGIVKTVRDVDESIMNGVAAIEVSAGGGYYIRVGMSEFEREYVYVGMPVTINNWETGEMLTGEVESIEDYPDESLESWSGGNNNTSFYPFTVSVDENANLREGSYVSVKYDKPSAGGDTLYLDNMFIREESGKSYVYVQGADGKLEKRTVQTGRNLWGSYTMIRGGLTMDDYLAFPYGKNVEPGADTVQAELEELWSY